ncbi:MAG TPA: hypothetical protein EYH14_02435 [Euryarchaeota archaeon]|nr:hypothetical protein [Euryarchaeota archaeon]
MGVLRAAASLGLLVLVAFFVGRLFAFVGILPYAGYLVTGMLFGAGLPPVERSFLFQYALVFLFAYLGYMASSRRIFSAPFQLFFVHPLRLAVGFALFFSALYLTGFDFKTSCIAGILLATSSSLVVRWGRNTSYALIERSILSMDALISGLILLYVVNEPVASILLTALTYIALMYSSSIFFSVSVLVAFALLLMEGYVGYYSLAFVLGVVLHHVFDHMRMHWAEGILQEVLPIVFLVGIAAWAGLFFTPVAGIYLVSLAFLSLLQNFVSLVVLGSVFGVSPKTGAHILARTFGPSEAALFAAAILPTSPAFVCAVLWFYFIAIVFSSYVRTEKDAEHLLSSLFPKTLFRSIEELEYAYSRVFVRHHVVFSDAYRQRVSQLSKKMLAGIILLSTAAFSLIYLVFNTSLPYRGLLILFSVILLAAVLARLLQWYFRFYETTIFFISDHAYAGKIRPGRSIYYFVAGFLLTLVGFVAIPFSVPLFNFVYLFFALLIVNAGLYLLLSSYAKIYHEFVTKKEYGL